MTRAREHDWLASLDIVAATLLTRGTYVFASIRGSGQSISIPRCFWPAAGNCRREEANSLLRRSLGSRRIYAYVLAGEGSRKKEQIKDAMQHFKVYGSGGAATSTECVAFATELGIPLVFDIGMTEIGCMWIWWILIDDGLTLGSTYFPCNQRRFKGLERSGLLSLRCKYYPYQH